MQQTIAAPAEQHHDHGTHDHHEMPTSGSALTRVALSATLHCLTGCAIGEVLGMLIGTALGWSNLQTIFLAVGLAFLFGYALTSLPLLRAGLPLAAVVPIALASDTLSIATMEVVDNAIMLAVPGAMETGVGSLLFWGSLSFALVVAGAVAVPVNRWLIARGKGHAVVHETGIHGGLPPRAVAIAAAVAFVFGSAVLVAEAFDASGRHDDMSSQPPADAASHDADSAGHAGLNDRGEAAATIRGLAVSDAGLTLSLDRTQLPRGKRSQLAFSIVGSDSTPLRDFQVEHTKRLHLIIVRRDLTGFEHLHPV